MSDKIHYIGILLSGNLKMNEEVILGLDAGNSYYKTRKGIVLSARIKFNTGGEGL